MKQDHQGRSRCQQGTSLFGRIEFEMTLRCLCKEIEQALRYMDPGSGEKSGQKIQIWEDLSYNEHLLGAYKVPAIYEYFLSYTLKIPMQLALYYCLHFNDEETENFPMIVQPAVVKPEENPRQADPRAQALYHLAILPGV